MELGDLGVSQKAKGTRSPPGAMMWEEREEGSTFGEGVQYNRPYVCFLGVSGVLQFYTLSSRFFHPHFTDENTKGQRG